MTDLQLVHTNDHGTACRLRDEGFEPVECAFGGHGSVLGPLAMDHHGTESHREGVALRACRDLYGARRTDPRFVVTGTPDADAVLAIVALAALVPRERIPQGFYELVNQYDVDPIGLDLLGLEHGVELAWFNQREGLLQSEAGFRRALGQMQRLLLEGIDERTRRQVRGTDKARRRKAMEGILAVHDRGGLALPVPASVEGRPVRRGAAATEGAARVVVLQSSVWGFDQWYRLAPVVVSYASRMAKVTLGCPDADTAERMFGPGGLMNVWPALGKGWGGRPSIGGSPRGLRLSLSDAHAVARTVLPLLRA